MSPHDLLIKNGELIDPATALRGRFDLAISSGQIAAIAPSIPAPAGVRVIDATGKLVVPGLIDLHTHVGFELHTHVIQADDVCPPGGVTTAIDMGSTGAFSFPWYKERVIKQACMRVREFINIASLGTIAIHNPYYVEKYGRYIDIPDTIRMIEEHRDVIRGIKVFASSAMVGEWALEAVRAGVRVGEAVKLPVAIHVSDAPPSTAELLDILRPGDIMTHSLTPHNQGVVDAQGQVKAVARQARERGVLFDVGHGAGSFSFAAGRAALEQGFAPDTISTDLYYANVEAPVKDLPTTMTKFLALGMSLEEVLRRVTCNPARAIHEDALGTLRVGGPADIAVLSLQEGSFTFVDVLGAKLESTQKLECAVTLYAGKVIYERGAA